MERDNLLERRWSGWDIPHRVPDTIPFKGVIERVDGKCIVVVDKTIVVDRAIIVVRTIIVVRMIIMIRMIAAVRMIVAVRVIFMVGNLRVFGVWCHCKVEFGKSRSGVALSVTRVVLR